MPVNEKALVIYHANCFDGYAAAWAAWRYFDDRAEYLPAAYGDAWPNQTAERLVYLVDFSYPAEMLDRVIRGQAIRPSQLIIRDHHKTAADDLLPWYARLSDDDRLTIDLGFDMGHSGATLTWRTFFPEHDPPVLLTYIEDRDLWRFSLPSSRAIAAWMRSWPFDFEVWDSLAVMLERNFETVVEQGQAILRFQSEQVNTMCQATRLGMIQGHEVPIVNPTAFYSEVGERLLELYPDAPFAAFYLDRADGRRQWGVRSRPDFDCSVIAKAMGGGGHKGAAGWVEEQP